MRTFLDMSLRCWRVRLHLAARQAPGTGQFENFGPGIERLAAAPPVSTVARLRESGKEDDSERLGVSGPEPRSEGAQGGWEDDCSIKTALTRGELSRIFPFAAILRQPG